MIGERLSHYRIEARLGRGGMGEVFLARDLALGRDAAIKVLHPSYEPEHRRRLLREAEASRQLQHPGIATFYETGDTGGTAFIAMEYVRGETLRDRLHGGALPASRAVAIATALLEALGHAHAAGIVHRDIKPENIMIAARTEGKADAPNAPAGGATKLLDFGLARNAPLGNDDDPATVAALGELRTELGAVLGTIGYMPPEQLRGETVDTRADLFAVGAVLFEMLTGQRAFPGATPVARIAATLSGLAGTMPPEAEDLQAIVRRALAPEPEQRYRSAAEFLRALQPLGEPGSGAPGASPDSEAETLSETIAVLDFETRSTDPADSWIGVGIAESLVADLARVQGIRLVPRPRVLRTVAEIGGGRATEQLAAGVSADPAAIGARLGCRWVLSGSCQRMGPALRVFMQITHAPTEQVAAVEKLDGRMDDIFAMQDRLSQSAAAALRVSEFATAAPRRIAPVLGAYECHTRGRQQFTRLGKGAFERAEEMFLAAIQQEPGHVDALSGLAAVHGLRFTFTTDRADLEKALGFARRAVELAPDHAEAHVWLGYALWRHKDAGDPLAVLRRASELAPESMYPFYFSACVLSSRGDFAAAVPLFQRALGLEPGFGFAWVGLGNALLETGSLQEAEWGFMKGAELERSGVHATAGAAGYLGECLRRQGRLREAREQCLAGLEAVERSDHMYRDTFRATCLNALGRTALDQGDLEAAAAAFRQSELHLEGRARTLGGGWLICQALAGSAAVHRRSGGRVGPAPQALDRARDLFEKRHRYDWSWFFMCDEVVAAADLARSVAEAPGPDAAGS